jgi:hypothetical protein
MKFIPITFFFIFLLSIWYSCKEKSVGPPEGEQHPVIKEAGI